MIFGKFRENFGEFLQISGISGISGNFGIFGDFPPKIQSFSYFSISRYRAVLSKNTTFCRQIFPGIFREKCANFGNFPEFSEISRNFPEISSNFQLLHIHKKIDFRSVTLHFNKVNHKISRKFSGIFGTFPEKLRRNFLQIFREVTHFSGNSRKFLPTMSSHMVVTLPKCYKMGCKQRFYTFHTRVCFLQNFHFVRKHTFLMFSHFVKTYITLHYASLYGYSSPPFLKIHYIRHVNQTK